MAAGDPPFLVMPGDTLAEMDTVNAAIEMLAWDIQHSKVNEKFLKGWSIFYTNWKKFLKDEGGWFDRGTSGAWNKTREYREYVNRWRAKFQEFGGLPSDIALIPTAKRTALEKFGLYAVIGAGAVVAWSLWRR